MFTLPAEAPHPPLAVSLFLSLSLSLPPSLPLSPQLSLPPTLSPSLSLARPLSFSVKILHSICPSLAVSSIPHRCLFQALALSASYNYTSVRFFRSSPLRIYSNSLRLSFYTSLLLSVYSSLPLAYSFTLLSSLILSRSLSGFYSQAAFTGGQRAGVLLAGGGRHVAAGRRKTAADDQRGDRGRWTAAEPARRAADHGVKASERAHGQRAGGRAGGRLTCEWAGMGEGRRAEGGRLEPPAPLAPSGKRMKGWLAGGSGGWRHSGVRRVRGRGQAFGAGDYRGQEAAGARATGGWRACDKGWQGRGLSD